MRSRENILFTLQRGKNCVSPVGKGRILCSMGVPKKEGEQEARDEKSVGISTKEARLILFCRRGKERGQLVSENERKGSLPETRSILKTALSS